MTNRLLTALETKRVLAGMLVFSGNATLVEMVGLAGFDWVTIDMEHSATTFETVVEMLRAAEVGGLIPLVRVGENDPKDIGHALDAGAAGVVVPHVETADDLRRVLDACRYPPDGSRGVCGGVRSTRFGLGGADWKALYRKANQDVIVVPLIEGRRAVENFDDILSVEGVDVYYFGPGDLSQSYGLPNGDMQQPELRAIASEVVGKATRAGKFVMTTVATRAMAKGVGNGDVAPRPEIFSASYLEYLVDLGFRLIDYGSDIMVLTRTLRQAMYDTLKVRERLSRQPLTAG